MNSDDLKELTNKVQGFIEKKGCVVPISVKVKPFPKKNEKILALYRSMSQFKAKPIFWINENLPKLMEEYDVEPYRYNDVVEDNMIHEYAHSIAEWAKKRDPDLADALQSTFIDEEEFAEGFIDYVKDRTVKYTTSSYDRVMDKYCKSRFPEQEQEEE